MNIFKEKGITHLDLHVVRHQDAKDEVIDFVYQYQDMLPLIIICGNSNRMIEIAESSLKSNSIMFSKPRFGIIRVEKL
jgi:hypothetical protein